MIGAYVQTYRTLVHILQGQVEEARRQAGERGPARKLPIGHRPSHHDACLACFGHPSGDLPLARNSPAASDERVGRPGATPRRMLSLRPASAGHDLVAEPRPKPLGSYPGCVSFPELKAARCSIG